MKESLTLSENEEPTTGPRAGFGGLLLVYIRTNGNAGGPQRTDAARSTLGGPRDDKSFFVSFFPPTFPSFHRVPESYDLTAVAALSQRPRERLPSRASGYSWTTDRTRVSSAARDHL